MRVAKRSDLLSPRVEETTYAKVLRVQDARAKAKKKGK